MTKYIRTKQGAIFEIVDENYLLLGNKKVYINLYVAKQEGCRIADTIEELCDEFIYQTGGSMTNGKPMISTNDFLSLKEWYVSGGINQNNIYGAIWTDKGLIYVAKMNSDGELELI